jgi:transcriptional regulator with XRE-family HTH domain
VPPSDDDEQERNSRSSRLREALKRRGVQKLYCLADDLGVNQSTISRWTSHGGMSLDHATALCRRLDISLDWLVFGRGRMDTAAERRSATAALEASLDKLEPELLAAFETIALALVKNR